MGSSPTGRDTFSFWAGLPVNNSITVGLLPSGPLTKASNLIPFVF